MERLELWRWLVLAILMVGAVVTSLVAVLNGETLTGLALNVGSEMAGAVVTYVLFEIVIARREKREAERADIEAEKARLIEELGSSVRDVAVAAAEKLSRRGWLTTEKLQGAMLEGANLQGADLSAFHLNGASLAGADLRDTNLVKTILKDAWLCSAKMQKAWLEGADLRKAKLWAAQLQGANLSWACLEGAEITHDSGDACFDPKTILPDQARWTPDTDMTRFTNPDHRDFWRCDYPGSPAYRGDE